MICANCQNSLRTIQYEGIAIETCDRCYGEWLDDAELGKIVRLREVKVEYPFMIGGKFINAAINGILELTSRLST